MRVIIAFTHILALAIGFAAGVYLLPILTAPESVDREQLQSTAENALYTTQFTRELRGSDFLHWGEGTVSVSAGEVVHQGKLAPGPDYRMYLVPEFVTHEDEFEPVKMSAVQIGEVKTFDGVVVSIPPGVDVNAYNTVVIWCEAFSEFITAAQYRGGSS